MFNMCNAYRTKQGEKLTERGIRRFRRAEYEYKVVVFTKEHFAIFDIEEFTILTGGTLEYFFRVDPEKFIRTILEHKVSYSFGSPAIWNVVSRYCLSNDIKLSSLKKVLMAGAPVPGDLINRVQNILPQNGEVHIPYGATECLPIVSIKGKEVLQSTWASTCQGQGTCVGRALPGIKIGVIKPTDQSIESFSAEMCLKPFKIGEIIVKGPVVTSAYDHNKKENHLSKIPDTEGGFGIVLEIWVILMTLTGSGFAAEKLIG